MPSPDFCEAFNSHAGLFLPEGPYIPKALPSKEVCYTHWCKEGGSGIIHQHVQGDETYRTTTACVHMYIYIYMLIPLGIRLPTGHLIF